MDTEQQEIDAIINMTARQFAHETAKEYGFRKQFPHESLEDYQRAITKFVHNKEQLS